MTKESEYAAGLFRDQNFVILSETRGIEGQEHILFEAQRKKDTLWQLSHDYLGLCARLAPPIKCQDDPVAAKGWWYEQLDMDPDAHILAKQFDRYLHLGTLLNVDEQPHIAMWVKTFHLLIEELLNACRSAGPEAQRTALAPAGRHCGRDFAAELNDIFGQDGIEPSLSKRIGFWAEFDSGVGLGAVHPVEIQEPPWRSGCWWSAMSSAYTRTCFPATTARSVTIFRETRNGVRPISGAKNQATAMAFGSPRSSCVRPGAHSAQRQDSRKDLMPYRMAGYFVSAGARAPHSDETPGPTATQGSSHSARRLRALAFLCSSEEEGLGLVARVFNDLPDIRDKA